MEHSQTENLRGQDYPKMSPRVSPMSIEDLRKEEHAQYILRKKYDILFNQ